MQSASVTPIASSVDVSIVAQQASIKEFQKSKMINQFDQNTHLYKDLASQNRNETGKKNQLSRV